MPPTAITEGYERQLWEELNALLAERASRHATPTEAEDAMLVAATGGDSEVRAAFVQVRELARYGGGAGYLHERWIEDGPVQRLRRRIEQAASSAPDPDRSAGARGRSSLRDQD